MKNFIFDCSDHYGLEFTKKWLSLLVVFGFFLTGHTTMAQCVPVFADGCDDGDAIRSLTIGSLAYSHLDTGCSADAYGDFTESETFPDLQAGETYTFIATHGYQTQFVRVWIDFDGDGVFGNTADTELVGLAASTGIGAAATTSIQVVIPSTAPLGTFRLRIATRFNNQPIPCNLLGFGEAHDYMVTILAPNPCVAVTGLATSGTTYNSTVLSWVSEGTSFDIEWGELGFAVGQGEGTLITGVTNQYLLNGLNENTSYQFYVRNNCGAGGLSSWAGPYNFFTGYCVPSASTYTGYIINGVSTLGGYTNISNTTGSTASTASYGDFTDLSVKQSPGGQFTYSVTVPSYTNVEIWADLNKDLVFAADELIGAHVYGTSATTFTGTIVLPADIELGDYRVRVRSRYYYQTVASACGPAAYGETEDYTLSVVAPPACLPPTDLTVGSITFESAVLSWESEGTLFDIEWGEAPLSEGEGTAVNGVANDYLLGGLNSDTSYQYYVRQNCGAEDGVSFWAGPYTFFTGYCNVSTVNTGDYTSSFSTTGAVSNVSYTATVQPTGSYTDQTAQIIEQAQGLSFNFATTYVGGGQRVNIWVDWNNDMIFDNSVGSTEKVYSQYASGANQSGTIEVPVDVAIGDYRVRVRSQWGTDANPAPCGEVSYGTTMDYILHVLPEPTCFPPTALSAGNLTYESAELSWESDGTLFDIEWGEAPLELGGGSIISGVSNQYVLGGLNDNTNYQYYVRSDCGAEDGISFWAGPFSFLTGYCVPSASTYSGYIINGVSTVGGYTNISNTTGSTVSTASYGDFTDLSVTQSPGGSFTYNVAVPGYTNVEIWVDFNNNLIFDTDELVGAHVYGTSNTTFTGTIAVPADIELGDYRLRVRSRYYSNPVSPCAQAPYGETEDYVLSVITAPACLPPTDLSAGNVTFESAVLSWESEGTSFDIEWGEAPLEQGGGTVINNVTSGYLLEGLNPDTNHQFYVRQDCGAGGESFWAGPYSFFTGYCTVSTTYTSDYTSSFLTTGAVSNVSYTASAQPTGSYANQTADVIEQAQGLSFDFSTIYVGGGQRVNIWIDWDNDMNFDNSEGSAEKVYSQYVTGATQNGTITIPEGVALGDYRVRVRSQWGSSANPAPCGEVAYGTTVDFTLHVLPAPTCFPPTGLTAQDATFESAELSWESDGTLFDIEWGEAPLVQGEGTIVSGVANQYVLGGLNEETNYQYYVRNNCGATDGVSFWSGPYSFFTGYCTVSTVYTSDYTSLFSTTGAISDVEYTASTQPSGSYTNQTANIIEQAIGSSFDFSTTYVGGSQAVNIWIDWNKDMVFDNTAGSEEKVFSLHSSAATKAGTITIPVGTALGDYRVRVRSQWGTESTTNPAPCGQVPYGSTMDFTLHVVDELSVDDFANSKFKLYPNPVKDVLHLSNSQNISNVEVFNVLGQQIIAKKVNASQGQVDMSNFAAGTYLVKITADNFVKTVKVIKQ